MDNLRLASECFDFVIVQVKTILSSADIVNESELTQINPDITLKQVVQIKLTSTEFSSEAKCIASAVGGEFDDDEVVEAGEVRQAGLPISGQGGHKLPLGLSLSSN